MTISRRTLLATVGTGFVAGCVNSSGEDARRTSDDTSTGTTADGDVTTTATPPDTPQGRRVSMGEQASVGDTRVTVANPRVRTAVVSRGAHIRVVADAGQYVVVEVTTDGDGVNPRNLGLQSAVDGSVVENGDPLSTTAGPNSYAFPFPAEQTESAAIRTTADGSQVAWTLPATIRETLAVEPLFAVTSIAVSRRDGERVLELTVSNDGDRDGRFVAQVSLEGFSGGHVIEFSVPAGGTHEFTGRPDDILLMQENHGGDLTLEYPTYDGLTQLTHEVSGP